MLKKFIVFKINGKNSIFQYDIIQFIPIELFIRNKDKYSFIINIKPPVSCELVKSRK